MLPVLTTILTLDTSQMLRDSYASNGYGSLSRHQGNNISTPRKLEWDRLLQKDREGERQSFAHIRRFERPVCFSPACPWVSFNRQAILFAFSFLFFIFYAYKDIQRLVVIHGT